MEIKKISKVFLLSVIIAMLIITAINVCANVFIADTLSAVIVAIVFIFIIIICTLLIINNEWVSKWLDR